MSFTVGVLNCCNLAIHTAASKNQVELSWLLQGVMDAVTGDEPSVTVEYQRRGRPVARGRGDRPAGTRTRRGPGRPDRRAPQPAEELDGGLRPVLPSGVHGRAGLPGGRLLVLPNPALGPYA